MAAQSFKCPNCGAPLDYDGSGTPTVRCQYCNNSVMVPDELRSRDLHEKPRVQEEPGHSISINIQEVPQAARAGKLGCILAVLITSLVLFIIGMTVVPAIIANKAIFEAIKGQEDKIVPPAALASPTTATTQTAAAVQTATPQPSPTPPIGRPVLTFGSKGIGPGLLNDARTIAVDGNGLVYVADYAGGRVQAFDSSGKYLHQWKVGESETIIYGLTANQAGEVFVSFENRIERFDGASGAPLAALTNPNGGSFGDLAATVDGGVAGVWYEGRWGFITSLEGHRDDLLLFNASGEAASTIPSFISGQTGHLALDTRIAIDGVGNIYGLSEDDSAVFKFTAAGKYVNRFGSAGDQPDQFNSPRAIAVDGQGRVFVADILKVLVFSPEGRFIDTFPTPVFIDSMAFDTAGGLWAVSRDKVSKFELQEK